jgi:hypothetical protein
MPNFDDDLFEDENDQNTDDNEQPSLSNEDLLKQAKDAALAEFEAKHANDLNVVKRMQQVFIPEAQKQEPTVADFLTQQIDQRVGEKELDFMVNTHYNDLAQQFPRQNFLQNEAKTLSVEKNIPVTQALQVVADYWSGKITGQPQQQPQQAFTPRQTVPGMLPFGRQQPQSPPPDFATMSDADFDKYTARLQAQS